MDWNQTFKKLLKSFSAEKVRYLLAGAYAVSFHGHSRYTADLDLWVEPGEENAESIRQACESVDLFIPRVAFENLKAPDQIIRLGVMPVQVDLLTSLPKLDFSTCWDQRNRTYIDGIEIPVLDLASLRITKRASGRFQDLADLENLPEA